MLLRGLKKNSSCLWLSPLTFVTLTLQIVVPFFSLFVKDMYFLNEGCSNSLENGHVNFEKFWQLAKQITDFLTWKQVEVRFIT